MRAGRLKHRVQLQTLVAGSPQQKPTGEPDTAWTTVATVWASIDPVLGREFFSAQQVQSEVDTKIRIRHRAGVTAADRIVHGGTVYNIKAVINIEEANVELLLMCARGVNNG